MSKHRFPKSDRLLSKKQFQEISKYGKRKATPLLSLTSLKKNESSTKLGLTVTKKYGKAVIRNRFKRLVREAFRLSKGNIPSQLHIHIAPKVPYKRATLKEIQDDLKTILKEEATPP